MIEPNSVYKVLSHDNSLVNDYLAELRDESIQKDRARFRKNIERIGQIIAYEISKLLPRQSKKIKTPLGIHTSNVIQNQPVLATILRAGLAMHNGFLNFFDHADNAFVSAYRKHSDSNNFEIAVEYLAAPILHKRILILVDPMLATGQSIYMCYKALLNNGTPDMVFIAGILASKNAIDFIKLHMPNAHIFIGDVDSEINMKSYIVPGLGDAGDLSYGEKTSK